MLLAADINFLPLDNDQRACSMSSQYNIDMPTVPHHSFKPMADTRVISVISACHDKSGHGTPRKRRPATLSQAL
jgi:hypothetical protein